MSDIHLQAPVSDEDLIKASSDAIAIAGCGDLISANQLADFVRRFGNGRRVDNVKVPAGISDDLLVKLIRRAEQWSQWPHRFRQLSDPAIAKLNSHVELRACDNCREFIGFERRNFTFEEISRIPLDHVPLATGCWCAYRTVRRPRRGG